MKIEDDKINPGKVAPSATATDTDNLEKIDATKVTELVEEYESESPTRIVSGVWRWLLLIICIAISVYSLYWTQYSITTQLYRASFLLLTLAATFLAYPLLKRQRRKMPFFDPILAILCVVSLGYLILNYQQAIRRSTEPNTWDMIMGGLLIFLVLEATRRAIGWILPVTAAIFLVYALFGPNMPEPFDHRGYQWDRIIGLNFLGLDGIFGVPLDVAATYIVLFSIYGAVLEYSGAGKFFIDFAFALLGRTKGGGGPGRTVTAGGFLLGTVSGSGVATTVTLGSVSWPMLKKAGYDANTGGAILSAAGIGAILSPPTLGAAAFLIAEYLEITYLDVMVMAIVPTILYYLSCFLMIEADSRRIGTRNVQIETPPFWLLMLRYGYHLSSLVIVAVLMAIGMTPFMAVFWAIVAAFALSFLRPETRLTSYGALAIAVVIALILIILGQPFSTAAFWGMMAAAVLAAGLGLAHAANIKIPVPYLSTGQPQDRSFIAALEAGGKGVLSVAATTATAGIIVGVVVLTGLGLKISGIIVDLAGRNLFLTAVFAAIAVLLLGLAVPVTASYIIAAVMVVPAFRELGVNEAAAHMFVFYYAVLSEVSPPTALSPYAAAALTGGNPFRTMMLTWKYCLPAYLVPFMFVLNAEGLGLLLKGDAGNIAWTFVTACLAVGALAAAFGGWIYRRAQLPERLILGAGGLALLYADFTFDMIGLACLVVGIGWHVFRVMGSRNKLAGT
jgi:TRAP transporter 4TM/12TM fusion protein